MPIKRHGIYRNARAIQRPAQRFTLNRQSPQAAGLINWWPVLGSPGGSVIRDYAGQEDGAFPGSPDDPVHVRDPTFGHVLDFGDSHWLDLGSNLALADGVPFSVSWWIWHDGVSGFQGHWNLLIGGESNGFIFMSASSATYTPLTFGSANTVFTEFRPSTDFLAALLSTWAHFTLTYDGGDSTAVGSFKLYYDGLSTALTTSDVLGGPDNANRLGHIFDTSFYLDGRIADFRLYDRKLSASDAYQIFAPSTRWDLYLPVHKIFAVITTALGVDVSDSISVAESISALISESDISVSESVGIAESITADVSDPQISVSENVSIAESINAVFVHFVNVSDGVSVAESVAIDPLIINALATENVSLAEAIGTGMLIPGILVSDSVSLSESVGAGIFFAPIEVVVLESITVTTPLFSIEIDSVTPAAVTVKNYARLLVGDITGRVIGELSVELGPISWRLNDFGRAQFTMSRKDSKATRDFLGFGNRVLFQFDNGLPEWGGVIDPDRQWTSDGKIVCTAYGGEYLLGTRATEQTSLHEGVTIGAVFEDIILRMNAIEETGIVLGDVWKGGAVHSPEYHYDNILDVIKDDLLELEAADFELQASLLNGKIIFTANLRERLGSIKRNVALLEGRNLALVELGERGPIVNVAYATGSRADWDDIREIGFSIDTASVADFGRREVTVQHSETEQGPSLDNIAQVEVDANKNPREILMLDAVDLSPARFADYGLGDTVRVWLYSYGFAEYDHLMRIVGREYYPATNLCRIVAMRDDQ